MTAANSGIGMFMSGHLPTSGNMNLHIKGTPPGYSSGNFPLFIYPAAIGEGAGFKTTTMFVHSFSNPYPSGRMNLFLHVTDTVTPESITNTMNLFMKGLGDESGFQQRSSNITMFIDNDSVAYNSGVTLFINQQTDSNASGYIPVSGFMNLFISRQSEAVATNFPMFINGPSGYDQGIELFMQALQNDRSGVSMYVDGIGESNNPTNLYSHGF
jgi:hypothetical protein